MKRIKVLYMLSAVLFASPAYTQSISAAPPQYPIPGGGSGGAFGPGFVDVSRLPNSTPGESSFSAPPSPALPADYPGPTAPAAPVKTQGKASVNQGQVDENTDAASSATDADTEPNDSDINDGTSSEPDNGQDASDSNGGDEQPNSESPGTASTP